ncbi:MAG: ATP-binding protein, partial [Holophaga sp.]|nr:ATP-binding protein [Holophaga sp.]
NMSHELRTPLNAILGFAQILECGPPAPTADQKASIEQVLKAGWYLLDLVNEILDLAKIDAGKVSLSLEPTSIADILRDGRELLEAKAQSRAIHLGFPTAPIPDFVQADPIRLKQIFVNLLSNAIKFNRVGGTVEVTCTPRTPERIRICVQDTGMGLSPEQLSHLFQPFNRLGQKEDVVEGTGVGLVVSKRLVELMGGTIGVESTVGKGCTFWIELDRAGQPQLPTPTPTTKSNLPSKKLVQQELPIKTVLYVEDNAANLQLVEGILARRPDLRLLSARDGQSGIDRARDSMPDVILMDISLPGINGIEALKILRLDPATASIPIVAISAHASPHDIEKAMKAGFFHYLTKPVKVRELMDTLDAALMHQEPKHTIPSEAGNT